MLTLSKQTQEVLPQTLITLGLMQYTLAFFNLDIAYNLPTVIAAGKAGGTTIVIISSDFIIISPAVISRPL